MDNLATTTLEAGMRLFSLTASVENSLPRQHVAIITPS
jgi:hypothetical protein